MTQAQADLFAPLASLLASEAPRMSPAELQGVICGLLATGISAEGPEVLGVLVSHAGVRDGWSRASQEIFLQLSEHAHAALHGDSLELELLLPPDDAPLAERVTALAAWCEGFMVGFGTGTAGMKDADLPPALQEAIADLAAISQVEAPDEEDDDSENMFEQVAEHCRMSALLVFTELALMHRREKRDNAAQPTRH